MWCAACQQDVPGVAVSANDSSVCCARCGQLWPRTAPTGAPNIPFEDLPEFIELEDWEFAETIQEAERLVRNVRSELSLPQQKLERVENAHASPKAAADRRVPRSSCAATDEPAGTNAAAKVAPPSKTSHTAPWLVLSLGLGVFVCGAALIALSLVHQSTQLWQVGLPMVLVGQVAVLAVVIWQLDAVWNGNRATFVALHAMDDQLRHLRTEQTNLQPDVAEEQPFYRHLADGANSDVLLADLKDQLDVLSQHLAQNRRAA